MHNLRGSTKFNYLLKNIDKRGVLFNEGITKNAQHEILQPVLALALQIKELYPDLSLIPSNLKIYLIEAFEIDRLSGGEAYRLLSAILEVDHVKWDIKVISDTDCDMNYESVSLKEQYRDSGCTVDIVANTTIHQYVEEEGVPDVLIISNASLDMNHESLFVQSDTIQSLLKRGVKVAGSSFGIEFLVDQFLLEGFGISIRSSFKNGFTLEPVLDSSMPSNIRKWVSLGGKDLFSTIWVLDNKVCELDSNCFRRVNLFNCFYHGVLEYMKTISVVNNPSEIYPSLLFRTEEGSLCVRFFSSYYLNLDENNVVNELTEEVLDTEVAYTSFLGSDVTEDNILILINDAMSLIEKYFYKDGCFVGNDRFDEHDNELQEVAIDDLGASLKDAIESLIKNKELIGKFKVKRRELSSEDKYIIDSYKNEEYDFLYSLPSEVVLNFRDDTYKNFFIFSALGDDVVLFEKAISSGLSFLNKDENGLTILIYLLLSKARKVIAYALDNYEEFQELFGMTDARGLLPEHFVYMTGDDEMEDILKNAMITIKAK